MSLLVAQKEEDERDSEGRMEQTWTESNRSIYKPMNYTHDWKS